MTETTTQSPPALTASDVLSTVGYDGFVRSLFNRSGDPSKDFAHAVLGIKTEIHELTFATDTVNCIEEAGDLCFYGIALIQVVADYLGTTPEELSESLTFADEPEGGSAEFYNELNDLLDHAKRWVGYGKAPKDLAHVTARATVLAAVAMAHNLPDDLPNEAFVTANVEKLLSRYNGMKFDAERAVNRDLPAERNVLEQSAG